MEEERRHAAHVRRSAFDQEELGIRGQGVAGFVFREEPDDGEKVTKNAEAFRRGAAYGCKGLRRQWR
jgi:hypothetical protein